MILLIDGEQSIKDAVAEFANPLSQMVVRCSNFEPAFSLLRDNHQFDILVLNAQGNEAAAKRLIESIVGEKSLAGLHTIAIGLADERNDEEAEPSGARFHYFAPPVMKAKVTAFLNNFWAELHDSETAKTISRVKLPSGTRPLIAWKSEYNIGVELIDRQHKQLVEIVNVLHNSTRLGGAREVLWDVLLSLIKYTKIHFESEESIFKKYGYPGYGEHKRAHEKLTAQVSDFAKAFVQQRIDVSPELMVFLKDWLMDHVLDLDLQSKQYLREKGAR